MDKLHLQKMLFLLSQQQEEPIYEFVPYHYGGYSFTAQWDINALCEKGFLREEGHNITIVQKGKYLDSLKIQDIQRIYRLYRKYHGKPRNEILAEVYQQYPYYAVRSKLLDEVLDKRARQQVEQQQNMEHRTILFTIGYEGRSLENYLNALIKNNIKVLVDVRKNPVSMKPGFSKHQLENYCRKLDIEYRHFPEVGIVPELRRNLRSQKDYDKLFEAYRRYILPAAVTAQQEILKILQCYGRLALTCFEADLDRCHRKSLAEAISKLPGFCYEIKHL